MQWRVWWAGPYSQDPPVIRVLWGWQPDEHWTSGYVYARHEKAGVSRLKWTCSQRALEHHTSQIRIPIGKWLGELTAEPDEVAPIQIAITARPRVYIHKEQPGPRLECTLVSRAQRTAACDAHTET